MESSEHYVVPAGAVTETLSVNETKVPLALLETVLQNSPDLIYFKDAQSRFVRYSRSLVEYFGLSNPDALVGKTDFDCYEESRARSAHQDEQRILHTGMPVVRKLERVARTDGKVTWFLTTRTPWRDKHGKVIGTFGISNEVTAMKEAEAELAYERELLSTLLDNSPDTIYFKDLRSRFVRVSRSKIQATFEAARKRYRDSHSPKASKEWPAHLASMDAFATYLIGKTDLDTYGEEFARKTLEEEQEIIRTGKPIISKAEQIVHGGRWMLTTKLPWHNKDGKIIGTFGLSRNITALKETEVKLEATHQRLVGASRLAGMAEVATSVLHNVGNVLNSVNVSVSLLKDGLTGFKLSALSKAAALLHNNAGHLVDFLASDAKGAQLPGFLIELSKHLEFERQEMLTELNLLTQNIEHIKDIVRRQQNYARFSGLHETVRVEELVEDALHMNGAVFLRDAVQVIRKYDQDLPPISVDKHKVLQILIHLVRNAKYACDESGRNDKKIVIGIKNRTDRIAISVDDNGVGIAVENLTRIFNLGFTTRKGGHGFGLHSGALAATELGGSLNGTSDGPGRGARFTLELPLQPPAGRHSERRQFESTQGRHPWTMISIG